jgi:hypothetical protein
VGILMARGNNTTQPSSMWAHPAGRHCFLIDATQMTGSPWIYNPY